MILVIKEDLEFYTQVEQKTELIILKNLWLPYNISMYKINVNKSVTN